MVLRLAEGPLLASHTGFLARQVLRRLAADPLGLTFGHADVQGREPGGEAPLDAEALGDGGLHDVREGNLGQAGVLIGLGQATATTGRWWELRYVGRGRP
ncbi:hypothetical protein [Roseomonas sp. WA12]